MEPAISRLDRARSFHEQVGLVNLLAEDRVIGARWSAERRLALWKWKYLCNPTN